MGQVIVDENLREQVSREVHDIENKVLARLTRIALLQIATLTVPAAVAIFYLGGINEKLTQTIQAVQETQADVKTLHEKINKTETHTLLLEQWASSQGLKKGNRYVDDAD